MAHIINIPTIKDDRGKLTVIEKVLPFDIKRVFFIYDIMGNRGGHRHKKTILALVCVNGKCNIHSNDGKSKQKITLNSPNQCLILNPEDWHTIENTLESTILLVLASEYYDKSDYIYESY